eukprot:326160-Chlamydomonas_euryale.AAC.6
MGKCERCRRRGVRHPVALRRGSDPAQRRAANVVVQQADMPCGKRGEEASWDFTRRRAWCGEGWEEVLERKRGEHVRRTWKTMLDRKSTICPAACASVAHGRRTGSI